MATMDTSQVTVGAGKVTGAIFVAATSVALPTDATTSLPSGFALLGYTSDAGVQISEESDRTSIRAWEGRTEVYNAVNEYTEKISFTPIQCNGDVAKLLWSNFQTVIGPDGRRVVLCYTPHKTALSSARRVSWPVHPDIWERLVRIRAASPNRPRLITNAEDVFMRLNAELRSQKLFVGTKGLYELRKICIDHIYQKFGAEMASSISGDDIRTVTRYYADPSAVQVGGVRIVELL